MKDRPHRPEYHDTGKLPPLPESETLRFLEPAQVTLFRAGATVRMTIEGECSWLKVVVLRAFPLTLRSEHFSVRDETGREVGILRTLDGLAPGSRRIIEEELERRYVVGAIRRIVSVEERFGTVDWVVETDRGLTRLTTRDLRDNIQRLPGNRFFLTDVDNNRFEIESLMALDRKSQALLLRHL